ncbi:hypothetical protein VTJ83DRAFT_1 [Remersonia thermophila]|uniref:Carboxylesterase type B domain-containing protein n=1 Tax=Remersonia thermophila TaxID=72144 RepID=A0ABR4DKF4_9PEZI
MSLDCFLAVLLCLLCARPGVAIPRVIDTKRSITYLGLEHNDIELFLGIPYGQDTGGAHRFRPPRAVSPSFGRTIDATTYGPACPQQLGIIAGSGLPVMIYIHGGGFWGGSNEEPVFAPDGLVRESVRNGMPVLHVAMNYRLGLFGFAQSEALRSEGSENAGLRDQRLALKWVQNNIKYFGGDPGRVTIFETSSGGLSVGMHMMAYGGSKPAPFQRAICQSQALEPGITRSFTIDAMQRVVEYAGCGTAGLHAPTTVSCLRGLDMETLLNASIATYRGDIVSNIGDIWLPSVDGDFLPEAPSTLIRQGRFAIMPAAENIAAAMFGWCENDVTLFTDIHIKSANDTEAFLTSYVSGVLPEKIKELLTLYPVSEFTAAATQTLSAEFFRAARIFRDIVMVCPTLWYAERLAQAATAGRGAECAGRQGARRVETAPASVYLYDWNQTILEPLLEGWTGRFGWGSVPTSEIGYIFANFSSYDDVVIDSRGDLVPPGATDYALQVRGSRSWSTFASTGSPWMREKHTFKGFKPAFPEVNSGMNRRISIFVAGGPHQGLTVVDGHNIRAKSTALKEQKLRERCMFLNSPEMIEQVGY